MARNRTQSNRQDGRPPQHSCTHERLREEVEVERFEGVSAAPNWQEKEACRAGNQGDAHSIAKNLESKFTSSCLCLSAELNKYQHVVEKLQFNVDANWFKIRFPVIICQNSW